MAGCHRGDATRRRNVVAVAADTERARRIGVTGHRNLADPDAVADAVDGAITPALAGSFNRP